MKILLIHNSYQYKGGEETYVESLKLLLEKRGHKVFFYNKKSENIKSIKDKIFIALSLLWNTTTNNELTKIINEFQPDIAHINNVYPLIGPTVYYACKKNGVKIVQTIHNYRFMCPKGLLFRKGNICELCTHLKFPFWAILYGCYHQSYLASFFISLSYLLHKSIFKTFNNIDTYIFPSQFTKQFYQSHLNIPENKSLLLPYFVQSPVLKRIVKKERYCLYVGRLSEEKGIIDLLMRFKNTPNINLKVIGTGPLSKKVAKYKKYKNIEILGFIERKKIVPILQKAQVLIIPSKWYEVLPFAYIEARTQGLPILVPNNNNFQLLAKEDKYIFLDENIDLTKTFFKESNSKKAPILRYTANYHYDLLMSLYKKIGAV
ncbi:MAG: glycosyltransferase [Candidatus Roizmanbacteria bacterium]|nr:glycosyltransferase [Candidatus Roizmanbacteria bacterium]